MTQQPIASAQQSQVATVFQLQGPEGCGLRRLADNIMVEVVDDEFYRAANGFTARREDGLTPNGNPIGRRWVLRDPTGAWVDVNQYRHDLFEHHGLRPAY